jgi:hypothetical protein
MKPRFSRARLRISICRCCRYRLIFHPIPLVRMAILRPSGGPTRSTQNAKKGSGSCERPRLSRTGEFPRHREHFGAFIVAMAV